MRTEFVKPDFRAAFRNDIVSCGSIERPRIVSTRWQDKKGTLDDEAIFGTKESYRCVCGAFSGKNLVNYLCPVCWSGIDKHKGRKTRFGSIHLIQPVRHPFEQYPTDLWTIPVLPAAVREQDHQLNNLYDQILPYRNDPQKVEALFQHIIGVILPSFLSLELSKDYEEKTILGGGMAVTPRRRNEPEKGVPLYARRICLNCHLLDKLAKAGSKRALQANKITNTLPMPSRTIAIESSFRPAFRSDLVFWSWGEVVSPRTNSPHWQDMKNTLDDESIFGCREDYRCFCGESFGEDLAGVFCPFCWSIVESKGSRKTKFGTIPLARPICHPFEEFPTDLWDIPVLPAAVREHYFLDSLYDQIVAYRDRPQKVQGFFQDIIDCINPGFVLLDLSKEHDDKIMLGRGMAITPRRQKEPEKLVFRFGDRVCARCFRLQTAGK